ncbi:lipopolysaccharide O-acetyltransferase [Sporomusaceae bacterium BoRhaA]|uniref:DapH/DapD/GlmU-related protein n=1 Tax=Pelorhabdus rhamnosifermentans TaxID=2772457 RepID=UPI001C05F101|nr:DapH/DapD/GlmU-related protein [Pelorhabdus rhamnosifermentans]MBU2699039.1 lipopolysaccharide O-acetyltransferase [Pelorhabdus rhamnosifermentans]
MNLLYRYTFYQENGFVISIQDLWVSFWRKIFSYILQKKCPGIFVAHSSRIRGLSHIKIGKNFCAGTHLWLEAITNFCGTYHNPQIIFKDNVIINDYVHIAATNYVEIGNNVLIASRVYISDHNHGIYAGSNQTDPRISPSSRSLTYDKKVVIGDNVWIGDAVAILPGVTIGEGSIIGANSVVTKNIPPASIAIGNPARIIKRFNFIKNEWEKVNSITACDRKQ